MKDLINFVWMFEKLAIEYLLAIELRLTRIPRPKKQ